MSPQWRQNVSRVIELLLSDICLAVKRQIVSECRILSLDIAIHVLLVRVLHHFIIGSNDKSFTDLVIVL